MIEIFWTKKNGTVGTAHSDREGKTVDFRPNRSITAEKEIITVHPPKGQEMGVEPLRLKVTRIEKRVIEPENAIVAPKEHGQHRIEEVVFASFEGVEVSATFRKYAEWYDKEAEAAHLASKEKEMARWHREIEEERNFLKNISLENLIEEATTSEIAKLRSGKISPHLLLEKIMARKAGDYSSYVYDEVKRRAKETGYLDQFKADLLSLDDRRKEERKQKWLAKEGRS
jgi:hypothetical protein